MPFNPFKTLKEKAAQRQQQKNAQQNRQSFPGPQSLQNAQQQIQPAATAPQGRVLARAPSRRLTTLECLQAAQDQLSKLRGMSPADMGAFPLLNDTQRLVQQLRESLNVMSPADKEVWQFQIMELDEEVREQTDRIMKGANNAPVLNAPAAGRKGSFGRPPSATISHSSNPLPLSTPSRPVLQRPSSSVGAHAAVGSGMRAAPARKQAYQPPLPTANSSAGGSAGGAFQQQQQPVLHGLQHAPQRTMQTVQPQAVPAHSAAPVAQAAYPAPGAQSSSYPSRTPEQLALASALFSPARQPVQLPSEQLPPSSVSTQLVFSQQLPAAPGHALSAHPAMAYQQVTAATALPSTEAPAPTGAEDDLFSGLSLAEPTSPTAATTSQPGPSPSVISSPAPQPLPVSYRASAATPQLQRVQPAGATAAYPGGVAYPPSPSAANAAGMAGPAQAAPYHQQQQQQQHYSSAVLHQQQAVGSPTAPHRSVPYTMSRVSSYSGRPVAATTIDEDGSSVASQPLSRVASSVAAAGSSLSAAAVAAAHVHHKRGTSGSWSAQMTAAAAAAHAAATGAPLEESSLAKKPIKKKTRGIKVGYGALEDETSGPPSHSPAIPGQPMPGPQYLAHAHADPQQQQQQGLAAAQAAAEPSQEAARAQAAEQVQAQAAAQAAAQAQTHAAQVLAAAQAQAQQRARLQAAALAQAQQAAQQQQQQVQQRVPQAAPAQEQLQQQPQASAAVDVLTASPLRHQHVPHVHQSPAAAGPTAIQQQQQQLQDQASTSTAIPAQAQQQQAVNQPGFRNVTNDPIRDLENYLSSLAGPVEACQQAAVAAGQQLMQQLLTLVQRAQQLEKSLAGQKRGHLAQQAAAVQSAEQLEAAQAAAVEREDFEAADTLDTQLKAVAQRRAELEAAARHVDAQCAQLAAGRSGLVARQAEAFEVVAAYLRKLQANQAQAADALAAHASADAAAAQQQQATMAASIESALVALAQRKVALAAAREDVDAKVRAATAPAQVERSGILARRVALEAEVMQLRAALAEREKALAAVAAAAAAAEERVQALAAGFSSAVSELNAEQSSLIAMESSLEQQAAALEAAQKALQERMGAAKAQQERLAHQGEELAATAANMSAAAARIRQRSEADAAAKAQLDVLRAADEEAQQRLRELARMADDLSRQCGEMGEQRGRLATDKLRAEQQASAVVRLLPELEAAKKAAAAKKDFKEAARVSAEAKATYARAEQLQQHAAQLEAALAEVQRAEATKQQELQDAKAALASLQRGAAAARHAYLQASCAAKRQQLEAAVAAEAFDEAEALQADAEAEAAEAAQLAAAWSLQQQQPTQQQARQRQPPPAPQQQQQTEVDSRSRLPATATTSEANGSAHSSTYHAGATGPAVPARTAAAAAAAAAGAAAGAVLSAAFAAAGHGHSEEGTSEATISGNSPPGSKATGAWSPAQTAGRGEGAVSAGASPSAAAPNGLSYGGEVAQGDGNADGAGTSTWHSNALFDGLEIAGDADGDGPAADEDVADQAHSSQEDASSVVVHHEQQLLTGTDDSSHRDPDLGADADMALPVRTTISELLSSGGGADASREGVSSAAAYASAHDEPVPEEDEEHLHQQYGMTYNAQQSEARSALDPVEHAAHVSALDETHLAPSAATEPAATGAGVDGQAAHQPAEEAQGASSCQASVWHYSDSDTEAHADGATGDTGQGDEI